MGKRVRMLSSALALGALLGSVFISSIGVSAAKSAKPLVNQPTCFFVCQGDGFNIYTIGVDAINPPTKNFEYTDFFPNGIKPTTTTSTTTSPNLTIRDGDVLHFLWDPKASADSAHTATIPALGTSLADAQNKYSPLMPDTDDGQGKFIGNPLTFNPTSRECGTVDNPCDYSGDQDLNSGFLTNHNGTSKPSEFYVKVSLDSGATTVHFFCALHRGMVGQVRVIPSNSENAGSGTSETKMAENAAAQYAKETLAGTAAELAANQTAVTANSDGSKTVTMTAGTAAPNIEVMEMLPNNVSI
jgi:hypothetical protein